ncbi:NADH:ubiquinone oxidoreductase subunit [Grosmannia clavigera kw1407]|uniref:NADH dehydrogenase [ubiquinone] 1 beta subcomplex subunit 11, mitochondrial n=5 Tax=Ophiostomataceae TaxID=5152 RepID=F0XML3_GROCL|nr:NADH:ubiquinone oxidoreductase subunit [Grosmannia clavigera kw1407]EFX01067.1 NADH:ubiquinone oxidoreductase subunit [Grosmannia clavigera kw1407]
MTASSAVRRAAASIARRPATTTTMTTTAAGGRAAFSSTAAGRSAGHHHESPYDAPTGWLFGVKPGDKYKNEGWEKPMFWGFCGSLVLFAAIVPFKPDSSIQTWALEEARRRLEAEGILADPFPEKK